MSAALVGIALAKAWFFQELEIGPLFGLPVGFGALRLSRAKTWVLAFLAAILWTVTDTGSSDACLAFAVRLAVLGAGAEAIGALRARVRAESRRAETDFLTGALNKRGFARRAKELLAMARDNRRPVTLAVLDVDDFKRINDTYGHPAGDAVLRLAVAVLQSELRPGDLVARFGGDEIVVFFAGPSPRAAEELVHRLRATLLETIAKRMFRTTFSIGAVVFPRPPKSLAALFGPADRLMYQIKRSGKNGIRFAIVGVVSGEKPVFVA